MIKDLLYTIPKNKHSVEDLKSILTLHPQIKFVSLVGVDLSGNDTDEKIPVSLFLDDIDTFLNGVAVQTDGSSVVLPGIATLNNAKVDMVADLNCNWFVDYNYDFIDPICNKPIGTLRIPCFLLHNDVAVDSRNILKSAITTFKENLWTIFNSNPEILASYKISKDDIEEIVITSATELEFWVKTPNNIAEIEELHTSQALHEQYWTRTKGAVRTAMEECLLLMDEYGFEPEMGHKEVGGVKAKLDSSGNFNHIMEQLEIDWKFSDAVQAADNELFIRILIQETFRRNGLEVTFSAKPLEGVAGSGMHTHLGISLKLKNGKRVNLFHTDENHFLSIIGYGALMGVLKNYEVMNPFISSTNTSFKRLKPGFEAPVCIVTSLGLSPDNPSRNRTILIGLIRDLSNPLATRFELRSPNPHSNTYITMAVSYMAMLDGMLYAVNNNKTQDELLAELSKGSGEKAEYLETDRAYRTEEDVFEHFSDEEIVKYFGNPPRTVIENISALDLYPEKLNILKRNNVMNDSLINSFRIAMTERWMTEIGNRTINRYMDEVRMCKCLHSLDRALDLDVSNWMKINDLRHYIMKDTYTTKSLFTRIKTALATNNLQVASDLSLELDEKMSLLRNLYSNYKKNLLDI
ncbi:glutamine synthetase [Clostridium sp. NSJ-6]|uniref:glutamine synthetase n=1 Tax=Clostridium hominis TaxID=2763036 RepID=A0ABR7DGM0_9CLOT|nr:glutamine synthetase [Clostridium hominis]MBC5630571.1 glutamine synthetase [Clostridium hominis]MDU2672129.1 glutamine synthetase [Clostridium sp.]